MQLWWVKFLVNGFRNLLANKLIKQSSTSLRTNGLGMWFRRSRTSFNSCLKKDDFNSGIVTKLIFFSFFNIDDDFYRNDNLTKKVFKVARVQP